MGVAVGNGCCGCGCVVAATCGRVLGRDGAACKQI